MTDRVQTDSAKKALGILKQDTFVVSLPKNLRIGLAVTSALFLSACVSGGPNLEQTSFENTSANTVDVASLSGEGTLENTTVPTPAPRPIVANIQTPAVEPTALVSEDTRSGVKIETAIAKQPSTPSPTNAEIVRPKPPETTAKSVKEVKIASLSTAAAEPAVVKPTSVPATATVAAPAKAPRASATPKVKPAKSGDAATDTNPVSPDVAPVEKEKPKSFFARLFSSNKKNSTQSAGKKPKIIKPTDSNQRPKTNKRVASLNKPAIRSTRRSGSDNALPGVKRSSALFGISREEIREEIEANNVKVASVGGFGRLSPTGLLLQHKGVNVKCLKPGLLRVLKQVERRYGRKVVVTSGYRSPRANRRAGGARRSKHILCQAADIQVPGVSKWKLAKYLRSIPGRGGVGTYCHTKSVHIDIGSKRDWNYRCRRSSVRKRKS